MELVHMTDIIPLIGIPYPPSGRSSYNIPCPCCDDKPNKKHLNINLQRDVFRCPRCGFSGGVFALYGHYMGITQDKVREALMERLNLSDAQPRIAPTVKPEVPEASECPLIDIEERHRTYTALLNRLTLASDHLENLKQRGLTEEQVAALGYRTTPVMGTNALAKQVSEEGCYLSGVPGFYMTEQGTWTFIHEQRGILIPVRDPEGRIQGMQIRRDNVSRRKFRWVSSVDKKDGCKAEGWVHLAGVPAETVLLTEGPMKADIIHALTGDTVIAVPGVNTLSHLEELLEHLRERGVEKIMTAFDMDFLINPNVQNGYQSLTRLLDDAGFQFGTFTWDPQYKGLDDFVLAQQMQQV